MSFFPRRFRSKSISTPHGCDQSSSQSCPNLLDLDDDDLAGASSINVAGSDFARTPGPELMSLASSPKGQKSKKNKSLFVLPVKFRRAKERKAQTQALKNPVYPINNSSSQNVPTLVPLQGSLEPPMNIRPKHTRPTGLGLGIGGLLGSALRSPNGKLRRGSDSSILSPSSGIKQTHNMLSTVIEHLSSEDNCSDFTIGSDLKSPSGSSKLRRGSDSCILSPSNGMKQSHQLLGTVIEHSKLEEDCNDLNFDGRQSCPNLLKSSPVRVTINDAPVSAPPICIVVSSSGNESRQNLHKAEPYKKFLGKSLELV